MAIFYGDSRHVNDCDTVDEQQHDKNSDYRFITIR